MQIVLQEAYHWVSYTTLSALAQPDQRNQFDKILSRPVKGLLDFQGLNLRVSVIYIVAAMCLFKFRVIDSDKR